MRRDDDAAPAVSRHVLTPFGWVQEADHSKLVMRGNPHVLVCEVSENT